MTDIASLADRIAGTERKRLFGGGQTLNIAITDEELEFIVEALHLAAETHNALVEPASHDDGCPSGDFGPCDCSRSQREAIPAAAQSARTPEIEDDLIKAITNELMAHGEFSTIQANNRPNAEVAARAVLGIVDRCFSREPNNADRQQTPDAWLVGWFRANGDSGTKAYVSEDDARSAAVNLEKYSSSETTASVLPLYASPIPEGDRGQSWDMRLADRLQQLTDAGCESLTILQVLGLVAFVRDGEGSASLPSTNRGSAA